MPHGSNVQCCSREWVLLLAKHKRKLSHDLIPNQTAEVMKLRSSFRGVFDSFKIRG
jgi:hypothetical protein